ncbi:MAG: hypothetical protein U1E63_15945 [Burkholderiales bacterium]
MAVRPLGSKLGPRRLVKRNDALFDLIRGRDLTRITSVIGWAAWYRLRKLIDWDEFRGPVWLAARQ